MPAASGPGGVLEPFTVGSGWHEVVVGTSPAAGANFSLAIPGEWRARLLSITFTLVTDANVASRFVSVAYVDNNSRIVSRNGTQGAVAASTTALFAGQHSRGQSEANTNNEIYFPIDALLLDPTMTVQINSVNKQAADQLSAITMLFERFLTGTQG